MAKAKVVTEVPQKEQLTPLTVDLGREDLNQVVAKLNEVIEFLNK